MALVGQASVSTTKAVFDILNNPHKESDANKLVLRQAVGKETIKHLNGRILSMSLPNLTPGTDTLVKRFGLLLGQDHLETNNILLGPGDPNHALTCRKEGWQSCDRKWHNYCTSKQFGRKRLEHSLNRKHGCVELESEAKVHHCITKVCPSCPDESGASTRHSYCIRQWPSKTTHLC